jgi:phosphotriesterase-related protein
LGKEKRIMGKKIPTLLGPVDTGDMGFTLVHEHLIFWPVPPKYMPTAAYFLRENIYRAKDRGIRTIVDVSPYRDVKLLQELCGDTGMNFILSTGYYVEGSKLTDPAFYTRTMREDIDMMTRDIEEGIAGTDVRAGVIKVAGNGAVLTPWEEKVFVAAGKASAQTKTPVCTHSCMGQAAQQAALIKGGADLNHVYYSHPEAKFGWEGRDVRQELEYYINLVKEGSSLMFNNFDFYFDTPKDELLFLMRGLADRGYLRSVLISIDLNFEVDGEGLVWPEASREHPETRRRNYGYIVDTVVPLLKANGFTQKEVDAIFIDNPKRIFDYV